MVNVALRVKSLPTRGLAYYLSVVEGLPDVIAISETKITKNALYLNINLHGYSFLHCDSKTKARNVAFYIKESLFLAEGIIKSPTSTD